MHKQAIQVTLFAATCAVLIPVRAAAQEDAAGGAHKSAVRLPRLQTVPVNHKTRAVNLVMVDASPLPGDKEGIWVLDFSFKPMRRLTREINGQRRTVHYLSAASRTDASRSRRGISRNR
jgi:hypothetical protein